MKALVFHEFGDPEVLQYQDVPDPLLSPGHAIVRLEAIGLNFADVYRRRGNYHLLGQPPFIAGYEGAGVIEALEPDASDTQSRWHVGDRVGFADVPFANAERVSAPLEKLISLPDDISSELAAALLLQGLTAQYLTRDSHPVQAGETALVHAAAGGVGLLLVQIARSAGARVIGLTSSLHKAQAARDAGADLVALYTEDWVKRSLEFTAGAGVDVAFDSVGSTLMDSLAVVRPGGRVVFYGMAGGDPPAIDPRLLMDTSKSLTGGDLWNVLRTADDRSSRAAQLFEWVRNEKLAINIDKRFALKDGVQAHVLLESRQAVGKVLLIP